MRKVEEYLRHVQECRQLAASSSNEESRRQLLEMADTWDSLARDRQEQVARQQRIGALETSKNAATDNEKRERSRRGLC
jgi:hypothetical protein